jgi:hypothetical protein
MSGEGDSSISDHFHPFFSIFTIFPRAQEMVPGWPPALPSRTSVSRLSSVDPDMERSCTFGRAGKISAPSR